MSGAKQGTTTVEHKDVPQEGGEEAPTKEVLEDWMLDETEEEEKLEEQKEQQPAVQAEEAGKESSTHIIGKHILSMTH